MDAQTWRAEQRRLREALRLAGEQRRVNGSEGPLRVTADVDTPDLLGAPIVSRGGAGGVALVAVKTLLRRLLAPIALEPQASFNRQVAERLAGLTASLDALLQALESASARPAAPLARFDYQAFEDEFHGSPQQISERQERHLAYFEERDRVLDIGCGRGEFLALLASRGVTATGVDMDPEMVASCRARGLTVHCADAVAYVEEQPNETMGGVFMGHLVEHLTSEELVALFDVLGRKCAPGAPLVVETIDPESLLVLKRSLWLDPTHVRLVHREALQFLAHSAGFSVRAVEHTEPVDAEQQLPQLELPGVDAAAVAAYNDAVGRANAHIFGSVGYVIVAERAT